MNLKVGIVGLPNAGKSTLFNALLKKQVAFAANYPFATIEPNIGIVPVPDKRLDQLADIIEKEDGIRPPVTPATVEFVDIAGLVKGAAQGEGLGNKFLAHIREVHLICHVIRFFLDPDVVHVAGEIDPQRDREIVETELMLADLQTLEKQAEPRGVKDTDARKRWDAIILLKNALNNMVPARMALNDQDLVDSVSDLQLLTMKPVLYIGNVSEPQLNNVIPHAPEQFLPICAKTESELAGLEPADQIQYLQSIGLESSGLDRLIAKSYEMLRLISFLTCGVKEVRAWTIPLGTSARSAAGVIHTDFEKTFIKADTVGFPEFIACGGWRSAREKGKVRQEGRDYLMQDGDVVEFRVGA